MKRRVALLLMLVASMGSVTVLAQTVSGTVTDAATGETLIGATVLDLISGKGTVTNAYGRYTLTLPYDSVRLQVSYIGYSAQHFSLNIRGNRQLSVKLEPSVNLDEITITADRINSPKVSQMSAIEVPVEQIKLVPVIFGETDVLKAIQLLPGVQSGTEGTSGIYVRGGGPDENLFLLDGVPLYNVNHLGGFFSAFNSDAIKNVTLYKGSFPARFSGRISSVLDITTNNGNDKEWHGGLSIGLISAKASIEGPIIKEKTTLSLSLRRTYGDLLIQPFLKLAALSEELGSLSAGYYFYDLNAKITHKFSERSRLYASFYGGDDAVYFRTKIAEYGGDKAHIKLGYNWGNIATALRWNYELTPKLFMNISGDYTRYRNDLTLGYEYESTWGANFSTDELDMFYNSSINDVGVRADFDYTPSTTHNIKFGAIATHHLFCPEVEGMRERSRNSDTTENYSNDTVIGESRVRAEEIALYFEDDWSITDALKINAGFVLSGFFVEGKPYLSPQPRLSGRFMLSDELSIKAGYSYMTQYLHLLSSSNISLPTDLWVPVTSRISPMNSHQVAAGLFYTWRNFIDFSVEGYYKWMNNIMEFRPGASFWGSSANWENKVFQGNGWAYGLEFLAQKSIGNITGWVGYTWSRTMRQFDRPGQEINSGNPFPAKYDRIHDISITLQYKPNDRFDCGITWVYATGNTATLALQEFDPHISGNDSYYDDDYYDDYYYGGAVGYVESRNNYRLPAYHRMDLSVNFHKKKKHGVRTFNISIYNVYNRQNPFFIYESSRHIYSASDGTTYRNALVQRSLFPILPSLSYIYKF